VDVRDAGKGLSRRGTSAAQVVSGAVLRTLLGQMERPVAVSPEALAYEEVGDTRVGRGRQRGSRRAAQGKVDERDAQGRGRRGAQQRLEWYTNGGGPSLVASAQRGHGRRLHSVDCPTAEVSLDSGHDAGSGVGKNEAGRLSRGDKFATLRPLLDTAGLCTQAAVAPMQDHAIEVCRPLLPSTPVLRAGDGLLADHGLMDGALLAVRQRQRKVAVLVPLRSHLVACDDAVRLADMAGQWQPHPSRATPQMAFVPSVEQVWDSWTVPLHACVLRFWHAKKHRHASLVLGTTDQELGATWRVNH
jgi:hypothetical protein